MDGRMTVWGIFLLSRLLRARLYVGLCMEKEIFVEDVVGRYLLL